MLLFYVWVKARSEKDVHLLELGPQDLVSHLMEVLRSEPQTS